MPDNRKPLIYGSFPVCRNYTVRAHIRDLGTAKRCRCENRQQHAGPLRRWLYAPHLHPRHAADAAKGRGENGQLHGTDPISPTGKQSTGKKAISLRCSFTLSVHFRVWVTMWVRQLTHILAHTFFSVFATKKHRKPKFPMLFGAGGVTRTHDLLITNQLLYRLSYTSASIQMRVRVYHKVFYSSSNFPNFLKAACRTTIHIGQVKK